MRNYSTLITGLACFLFVAALPYAYSEESTKAAGRRVTMVRLMQGEEIQLPGDFVAKLDGNKLKLALKSFAVDSRDQSREMLVSLIEDDGTTRELPANENGEVIFENVKEGLAALVVATGQAAYLALPLFAESAPAGENLESPFEVSLATIDATTIRKQVHESGNAKEQTGKPTLLTDYKRVAVNRFQVRLKNDGALLGHVLIPEVGFERSAGEVDLAFYQKGTLVGVTRSAADGSFAIGGLIPGIHSVVASGPPGHAAFSFEVMAAEGGVAKKNTRPHWLQGLLVSVQVDTVPADELAVLLIPPRMIPAVQRIVDRAYYPPTDQDAGAVPVVGGVAAAGAPAASYAAGGYAGYAGGGFAGGGFGGGGGGGLGGIGGLGGLLGIAGLAVGVAALSNENEDQNNLPPATIVTR